MIEFLLFMNKLKETFPFHLEITYNKTCDWQIYVFKKGCSDDYPEAKNVDGNVIICDVQDGDMEMCFAKAQISVKEWLLEFENGY